MKYFTSHIIDTDSKYSCPLLSYSLGVGVKKNPKRQNGYLKRPYIAETRREGKGKGEKERYTHLNAEFQRIAQKDKKAFLSEQCKTIEENNRMEKIRDFFKKIRDTKGTFHAKMGSMKDRNGMDLTEAEDIKKSWQEYTEEPYKKIFTTQIITMV